MFKRLFLCLAVFSLISVNINAQGKKYYGDGHDDLLRIVPMAAVVTLNLCDVKGQSDWKRLAVCGGSSLVATAVSTWSLKRLINDTRPDGTDNKAFPSGHAAIAFAGARMLDKEYKSVSPWIGVAGYSVATITAIDRVCRNRHHWEDVVAGAAIGIGATELGYWLGDKLLGKDKNYAVGFDGNAINIRYTLK